MNYFELAAEFFTVLQFEEGDPISDTKLLQFFTNLESELENVWRKEMGMQIIIEFKDIRSCITVC